MIWAYIAVAIPTMVITARLSLREMVPQGSDPYFGDYAAATLAGCVMGVAWPGTVLLFSLFSLCFPDAWARYSRRG
jgi:hypothetical protein